MRKLSVVAVMRSSFRAWRRDFVYVTVLAAIVETPLVLVELAVHATPGLQLGDDGSNLLTVALPMLLYGMLSHHFLSGVMESVEGAERHGHARPTMLELVRTLPWAKLLIADLTINLLIVAGLALLIVPGLVAGTYFAIALPLTNMEGQSIGPTLRRSHALTKGNFLGSLAVWVLSAVVFDGLQELASEAFGKLSHSNVWEFAAHLGTDVIFLPIQALPIVMLAFDLVELGRDRLPPPVPSAAH